MASILPIWSLLGLAVVELGRGTRQTDGRTDRHCSSFYNATDLRWSGHDKKWYYLPSHCLNVNVLLSNMIFMKNKQTDGLEVEHSTHADQQSWVITSKLPAGTKSNGTVTEILNFWRSQVLTCLKPFLRASAMLKHVLAIGWTSVRLSVRHTLVLYQNGWTYCQAFFATR